MRVLALDIATTTGWAVIDAPEKLIACGSFKIKPKLKYRDRMKVFKENMLALIEKYSPTHVAIEDTFVGVNPKTTALLNYMKGTCMISVPDHIELHSALAVKIRSVVLPPKPKVKKEKKSTEIKLKPKEVMFNYIVSKFKLKDMTFKKHNDITDAIGLALWCTLSCKSSS